MSESTLQAKALSETHLALIVGRLRNTFALDYESARSGAEDVMINLLALSRAARAVAEAGDFARAPELALAICTLAENLALADLAEAGRTYAAGCDSGDPAELRAATRRLQAVLATFGIADVTLEQEQLEDEA
ncbi:MAG: hypothetical protein RBU25_16455 [Lentisphaeria bacterium]|nr:hypothetical protein [Lentisphaeria bacterium]